MITSHCDWSFEGVLMKLLEREHYRQHFFLNLGVSLLRMACIGDWLSLLKECSFETLLACVALYLSSMAMDRYTLSAPDFLVATARLLTQGVGSSTGAKIPCATYRLQVIFKCCRNSSRRGDDRSNTVINF